MYKEMIMKVTLPKQDTKHLVLLEFNTTEATEIMGLVQNSFYPDDIENDLVKEFRKSIFNTLKKSLGDFHGK